ncbi:MAG: Rpn family recombination-promoting nuclease/putative transposase, partial [Thermoguttaceae bacterium]
MDSKQNKNQPHKNRPRQNQPTEHKLMKATSDVFIAALLSAPKNEPILCGIINAVVANSGWPKVRTATVLNPFSIKEFADDKRIVLDVRVEDECGKKYNIEVQTTPQIAFSERILFGWAESYSMQIHAGHKYTNLLPVFCIVITEFNI